MSSPTFEFHRTARSHSTALIVASIWVALLSAWVWLDAALWLLALIFLFTLPALADLIRNPKSGLRLDEELLGWFSGRRVADVALEEIEHVRFDTRLDFSVRVSIVLRSGRRVRLPFELTPPHQALEDALEQRGIKTQRYHFQLLQ